MLSPTATTRSTLELTVPPAELTQLLRGEAVSADIPSRILSALDWLPQEVEGLLASLPDIPVIRKEPDLELERGSLSIANSSTTGTDGVDETGQTRDVEV